MLQANAQNADEVPTCSLLDGQLYQTGGGERFLGQSVSSWPAGSSHLEIFSVGEKRRKYGCVRKTHHLNLALGSSRPSSVLLGLRLALLRSAFRERALRSKLTLQHLEGTSTVLAQLHGCSRFQQ